MFCVTWYLSHSQVHNDQTVPIKISAIRPLHKGYTAYFIAHARYGHSSTSGLKSNITIVFLDPDFPQDAKISAIRIHLRHT